jgi:PASTA domain/TIR domain
MRAIFISYRREDAEGEAGRLFDDLVDVYGENSVFMDVAAIEAGQDFRKVIDQSVATCGVLLAIIGKDWVDAKDESGQRRLDSGSDFVRLETASALKRDIPVIPVLVHGARMPRAEQLPDDLKDLAYRNCVELTGARWRSDVQLLIKALRPHVGEAKGAPDVPAQTVATSTEAQPAPAHSQTPSPSLTPPISPLSDKKPFGLILGIVAAVVVIAAVVVYMLLPSKVIVPDLTGMTLPDASAKIQSLNLVVGLRTTREAPAKDPNTILNQSPAPNSRVNSGTAINLIIAAQGGKGRGGMRPNPTSCRQGYVWREAAPGDYVCVLPVVRSQAQNDNAQADARRAGFGPSGPDTCKQGYVWREAFPNDHVCVTPATRQQAAQDNATAGSRTAPN